MSTVVLSLFGDEIIPEQINAVGKSRAARKTKSAPRKEETEPEAIEAIPEVNQDETAPVAQTEMPEPEITHVEIKPLSIEDTLPVIEAVQTVKQEIEVPDASIEPEFVPGQVEDVAPAIEIIPEPQEPIIASIVEMAPGEPEEIASEVERPQPIVVMPEVVQEKPVPEIEAISTRDDAATPVAVFHEAVKTTRKPAAKKAKATVKKAAIKKEIVKREKPEGHSILEGWTPDKQYYSIGEVATLFYVATSHIRFWTNEFALKVRTTRKGDRLYSPEQINELRTIYHLVKEKGYTIAGAKARLKEAKKTPVHTLDLKQSLLQLRNKLVDIKNQI